MTTDTRWRPVIIINDTDDQLSITGSKGSDLRALNEGQIIPPHSSAIVIASFYIGSGFANNWDWIYLENTTKPQRRYQLYMQCTSNTDEYAFFGWFDPNSNEANGNPSPFEGVCSLAFTAMDDDNPYPGGFTYVLLKTPT